MSKRPHVHAANIHAQGNDAGLRFQQRSDMSDWAPCDGNGLCPSWYRNLHYRIEGRPETETPVPMIEIPAMRLPRPLTEMPESGKVWRVQHRRNSYEACLFNYLAGTFNYRTRDEAMEAARLLNLVLGMEEQS